MRLFLLLFSFLSIMGCTPSGDVTEGNSTSGKAINHEAPFIWSNKTFPKTIRISTSFSATELAAIDEMSVAWEVSVSNKNFFTINPAGNNNYNINDTDGVFGVYKATTWPSDVSDDALAITQLFGRRYNIGEANEYVSIVEADILVNYTPGPFAFQFDSDTTTTTGFDLRTVILHELGHFLGLQHIPSFYDRPESEDHLSREAYKATSVMYPSISALEEKRIPKLKDTNALVYKYNLGGGGSAIAAATNTYQPQNNDPGKNVKIIIELKPNGECVHKENGAVVRRHYIILK